VKYGLVIRKKGVAAVKAVDAVAATP